MREHARVASISRDLGVATLAGWVPLVALLYGDNYWVRGGESNLHFLLGFDYVLCPLTVLTLALREHLYGRLRLPFEYLGDISYATYLLHFPLQLALALIALRIGLTSAFFMQGWVMIAFYIVLVAAGAACYRFFERPMQSWLRDRLGKRSPASN